LRLLLGYALPLPGTSVIDRPPFQPNGIVGMALLLSAEGTVAFRQFP